MKTTVLILFAWVGIAGAAPTNEQPLAILLSEIEGVVYRSSFTRTVIEKTPSWQHHKEENPPLSPVKAMRAAHRMLESIIPASEVQKEWRFSSLTLTPTADAEAKETEWFYVVRWSSGPDRQFRLYVLMNGECIEPKKLTPNKALNGTSESRRKRRLPESR
jgi:hypothetical protein